MNSYAENCTVLIPVWETGIVKNVLSETCKLISAYVKKIVVLHCGPKSEFDKCKNHLTNINNLYVEHFEYKGEAESILSYLSTFVIKNEWALFLDSDHRPTESLLLNLKNSIDLLENNNCHFGSFATIHHEFINKCHVYGKDVPKNQTEVESRSSYTIRMLCKITDNFKVFSNKGMHYSFQSDNNKSMYLPYGLNHYKLYFEYYSSIFLCGYSNPTVHSFSDEEKLKDENCKHYYDDFETLKIKYNMRLSNDFKERSYNNDIPVEFLQFFYNNPFLKCENPDTTHFLDHSKIFCEKYNFKFEESFSNLRYCGNDCCVYGGIQY